jgi:hypothetical protein
MIRIRDDRDDKDDDEILRAAYAHETHGRPRAKGAATFRDAVYRVFLVLYTVRYVSRYISNEMTDTNL